MKKMLILILSIFTFLGCVSIDYVKTDKHYYEIVDGVEIYWEKPSFDYKVLGRFRITGEFASESMMIEKLIKKAKSEGVNGVIILNTAEDDSFVWTNSGVIMIDTVVIHALAIRYWFLI